MFFCKILASVLYLADIDRRLLRPIGLYVIGVLVFWQHNSRLKENKEMKNNIVSSYTIAVLFCCFVATYISILMGIVILGIISLIIKRINWSGYLFVSLLLGAISFTNYTDVRDGDYDIIRYYTYWANISNSDNFVEALIYIYTMSRDYGFYFFVYILTRVLPDDPRWFSFSITSATAFLIFLSFSNFCKKENLEHLVSKASSLVIFTLGFFCVIRFYDFTNALRQHFAFCLFLYVISTDLNKKVKIFLSCLPIAFHWSIAPFVIIYIIYSRKDFPIKKQTMILWCTFIIGTIGLGILQYLLSSFDIVAGYISGDHQELGIDKRIMIIMALCTVLINRFCHQNTKNKDLRSVSFMLVLITILFALNSTMIIRNAYNFTDFICCISPILFYKSNLMYKGFKLSERVAKPAYLTWTLFIMYNIMLLNRGSFEYLIFTRYGIWSSFYSIVHTVNPISL